MKLTGRIILTLISCCSLTAAQQLKQTDNISPDKIQPVLKIKQTEKLTIVKDSESKFMPYFEKIIPEYLYNYNKRIQKQNLPKFDIISSFRSNIRFGGFWDKYTVVNVTPQMSIKPYDFLSFYALRSSSYFIPMQGIKENFKSMALRGAAVMIVDNTVKFLFSPGSIVGPIVGFVAKNALITVINKSFEKADQKNDLHNYEFQYYSVSIKF